MTYTEKVLIATVFVCMIIFLLASAFIAQVEYDRGVRDAYEHIVVIDTLSNGKTVIVKVK